MKRKIKNKTVLNNLQNKNNTENCTHHSIIPWNPNSETNISHHAAFTMAEQDTLNWSYSFSSLSFVSCSFLRSFLSFSCSASSFFSLKILACKSSFSWTSPSSCNCKLWSWMEQKAMNMKEDMTTHEIKGWWHHWKTVIWVPYRLIYWQTAATM